jgi:hypothetical protein
MPRNKNRLYLAFYAGAHHHQALLLLPKTPALAGAATGGDAPAWRFHAVRDKRMDRWAFVAEQAPARTRALGALVLLGKTTASAEELRHMLRGVPLAEIEDCTAWATAAIQVRGSGCLCAYRADGSRACVGPD